MELCGYFYTINWLENEVELALVPRHKIVLRSSANGQAGQQHSFLSWTDSECVRATRVDS